MMNLLDDIITAQNLGSVALDYARAIINAEENHLPVGSAPVVKALSDLHIAAIIFATQLATSECRKKEDTKLLVKLRDKLIKNIRKNNAWAMPPDASKEG